MKNMRIYEIKKKGFGVSFHTKMNITHVGDLADSLVNYWWTKKTCWLICV